MLVTMDMLRDIKKAGTNPFEYTAICPECGRKGVFYFSLKTYLYCCHHASCEIKGKIQGFDDSEHIIHNESLLELKKKLLGLYNQEEEIHEIDLDKFSEPLNSKKYPFAYSYIKNRKFTDSDIQYYSLRVGKSYYDEKQEKTIKNWEGRVIFPFMDCGKCYYAIGRSYNDSLPKYLNTDGEKSVIVYNLDKIKNRTCIVCEGLISSIFAEKYSGGISAVCLLGCSMSNSQFWQIRSAADKVYISLDGNTEKQSYSMCKRFFLSGADTYLVELPVIDGEDGKKIGLDPAEVGEDYFNYINSAKRFKLL